jgi:hypothetical protein
MHVLPCPGKERRKYGRAWTHATIQFGDAATRFREEVISELSEPAELESSAQIRSPHRVADAVVLAADFYLSTPKSRRVSREALAWQAFDGEVSGRRTFSNEPNAR